MEWQEVYQKEKRKENILEGRCRYGVIQKVIRFPGKDENKDGRHVKEKKQTDENVMI